MIAPVSFFSTLVSIAIAVTVVSPVVLLVFLYLDFKRKQLW